METKTITHEVFLNATPHEVSEAYIDEKQHAEFSGAPATIARRAGGRFTAYDAHLNGTTQEIEQDRARNEDCRAGW